MSDSETRAAIGATLVASINLLVIWYDSLAWALVVPFALLILVAVTTPVARDKRSRFWVIAQSVLYFAALTIWVAAGVTLLVAACWQASTTREHDYAGLAVIGGAILLVLICGYGCLVLWIDQEKLGGRLFRAWPAFAIAPIIGTIVLVLCEFTKHD